MATFKATKNASTKQNNTKTFKATRNAGYDSNYVYKLQSGNTSAIDTINKYNERIKVGEWLSNEDRAAYKSAIDTYTSTGNSLRDVARYYGTKYTDEEDKSWQDSISSLNSGYIQINDYYTKLGEEMERERKNSGWFKSGAFDDGWQFGDLVKTGIASINDLRQNFSAGLLGIGEKTVDALAHLGQVYSDQMAGQNAQSIMAFSALTGQDPTDKLAIHNQAQQSIQKGTSDFIAKDLYDEEKLAKAIDITPEALLGHVIGVGEDESVFGEKSDSLVQSMGQMGGQIALQAVGVPWYVTSGLTSFGSESENALNQGANFHQAGTSALISAGAEVLSEKLFGGSALGETGLIPVGKITSGISNKILKSLLDYGIDVVTEGGEEVFSSIVNRAASSLYKEENLWELISNEEALEEYLDSFIGGAVMSGLTNTGNMIKSVATKTDYHTGLTKLGEANVDQVYNDTLAKLEANGETLTNYDKQALRETLTEAYKQDQSARVAELKESGEKGRLSKLYSVTDIAMKKELGGELTEDDAKQYEKIADKVSARDKIGAQLVEDVAKEKISNLPGFTEEAANVMTKGYDGAVSASEYIDVFDKAYKLGESDAMTSEVVNLAHSNQNINQSTLLAAYDLGRQAKEKSVLETTPTESDIINTESEALTNEGTSEGAGIHLRRGSERNDGSYPQEQVLGLESRPGTNRTRGEGSRPADGEAANLVNEGREVRVADLGILNGSKTQTVRLVDANKETTAMKKARKDAESRGLKIKFFVGDNIVITEKTGEISAVRAYVLSDTMLVRADHPVYTADQLERHEAGHVRIERGEINPKDVRKRLEEIVGKEAVEGVAEAYAELYAGTRMDAEEIWEECICDFLGDINIFSKSANGSLVVNELINQTQAIVKEQKAEPNQTRGSPDAEGKASREIDADGKSYWQIETDKDVFANLTNIKDLQKAAYKFILHGDKGSKIVDIIDGERLEFIRISASEYVYGSDSTKLTQEEYKQKMRMSTSIIDLIENASITYDAPDHKKHKLFPDGFKNYQGRVGIDATIFKYIVRVGKAKNGKIFYDICLEVDGKVPRAKRTSLIKSSTSTNSIPQNDDLSTQNSKIVPEGKASRELDVEYLSAVERGDMETAQKMVDEAAKEAGYTVKAYHGTREDFNEFLGGAFFTDDYFNADGYAAGERVIDAYLKIENPLVIDAEGRKWDDLSSQYGSSTREIVGRVGRLVDKINSLKYDGIIFENINDNWIDDVDFESTETVYYIFDSKQAKSADSVTYDDDGNVIPLSERFNSESNDIRYSRELDALDYITPDEEFEAVETQAFSNRSLLANALLDTITSSEEYKLIRSYQEEIAQLDKSDKRLAQLKKDRNQLYKQEKPNFEVIRELNEKIKTLEGEIVNRDKRLLRLESTTALKNVLERARKDAYAKAMQKGKETMHRAVESRHKTIERNKAQKTAHELETLLNKNDKKRNVKLGEQAIVRAALDLSDMYFVTDDDLIMNGIKVEALDRENDAIAQYKVLYERLHATDDDVTNHKEERAELRHEMNEVKKGLRDLLERERIRINNATASSVYDAVINEYKKLQDSSDTHVSRAFDAKVLAHLEKLKTDLGNKPISNMTLEELKNVNKAFSMVKHMVVNSNKMFREGRTEDIQERSTRVLHEISKVGKNKVKDRSEKIAGIVNAIDELGWNNLRPVDAFELIGSDSLSDLFWDAISAQDVYAKDIVEYSNALEAARIKYGYKNWEFKPVTTFKTFDGRELKLTLGDMMSIYAYSKRAQADKHLREGGIQFKKNAIYKDKKGVTRERSSEEFTYKISDALRLEIISKLTQEQRAYVDDMQQILTDWGEKGNEVTRVLYGIDLFNDERYFPLRSARDYLSSVDTQLGETVTTASLVGSGFTKSTTPNADNPIILDSFDNVVHEHIDRMSKYHAYVIPIENLRKVLDSQVTDSSGNRISLKAKIKGRLGDGAQKYLEKYLTDLNGGIQQEYGIDTMKFFSKAKGAAVAANLSVWVQQYFSVIRAMNEIDPKYFASFVGESYAKPDMKLYEEMKKYAPITVIKEMGGFDVGVHGSVAQHVGQTKAGISKEMASKKMQEAFGVGANVMDKLGWMTIWKAVKKEIAATGQYKLGSEEFYNACGKRMNEVITKTQVYDSVNARSGNMRSKSDLMKMATSFLGEPTTIMGMVEVASTKVYRAIKSGDKKAINNALGKLGRTMATISISTAMTSIFKSLIYAMRDDDEDETYFEKYAAALAGAFRDDVNLLGYFPFARDIVSIIEGATIERPDMTLIEDLVNATNKLVDRDEDEPARQTFEEAINLIGAIGNLFGVPIKNIVRDLRGLYNTVTGIGRGYDTNLKNAIGEGLKGKDNTKSYNIYIAELRGDTNRINYYKSTYKDDEDNSKYYSALRKAIRENDPRVEQAAKARLEGDNDTYYNLMYDVIEEDHFDSKIIKEAFKAEYEYLKKKQEEAEDEE